MSNSNYTRLSRKVGEHFEADNSHSLAYCMEVPLMATTDLIVHHINKGENIA